MTESNNPVFIATKQKARAAHDTFVRTDGPVIGGPREGMSLAEFTDETAYGAVRMAAKVRPNAPIQETYPVVAILSVSLEDDIIRWMRANPDSVATIMKGR